MPKSRVYRVFVSSPSDVFGERERIERVIGRLNGELGGGATLEAIRWEQTYYTADKTFQDQIVLPSQTDLVICILWKRLGAELPPAYRRPDGTTPTGTEYEFEEAIQAAKAKGTPDVLVYRKTAAVLLDANHIELEKAQFDALKLFWSRWFQTDAGHFTAAFESFDTTDQFEIMVEGHIRQWLARNQAELTGNVVWPVALKGSPFRGLEPFDEAHAAVFFGRRRVVERIREALAAAAGRGTPFLLLLGASGSGKSSVARAGVVPRLTQIGAVPGIDVWRRCVMRPSEGNGDPLLALAQALYKADVLPELGSGDSPAPADFAALLRQAPEAAARSVARALERAGAVVATREGFDRAVEARLLVLVDQFEEALHGEPETRENFGRALQGLAASGTTWVLGTLRSDLYAAFQGSPAFMALRERGALFDLLPPTPSDIAEIVTGPAQAAGLRFDARLGGVTLDEELAVAALQPGSLPLLQLALDALFEARDPQTNTLSVATYDGFGGLAGVVERRAEGTLASLDPDSAAALPKLLAALVNVAESGVITSRPVARSVAERAPGAGRLIDSFVAARLLLADDRSGETVLRVAHEALIGSWPRARSLIAADRDALRVRGRVEDAAERWATERQHPDFLLPAGRPLAEALDLAATRPDQLSSGMAAYISASQSAEAARQAAAKALDERELRLEAEAAQARAEATTRIIRRTRVAAVAVSLMLLVAVGAAATAAWQWRRAKQRALIAEGNFQSALTIAGDLGRGSSLSAQHDYPGALKSYRAGLRIAQDVARRDPEANAWVVMQRTTAMLHRAIGTVSTQAGDSAAAQDALQASLDGFAVLADKTPQEPALQDDVVEARHLLAIQLFLQARYAAAATELRAGIAQAEAVARAAPTAERAQALAALRSLLGETLRLLGDTVGALAVFEASRADAERLHRADADAPQWLRQLADSQRGAGAALQTGGKFAEAADRYRAALAAAETLTARDAGNSDWQHLAIDSEHSIALNLGQAGDYAGELDHASKAIGKAEALLAADPKSSRWRMDAGMAHLDAGVALKFLKRDDEAEGHIDRAKLLISQTSASGTP